MPHVGWELGLSSSSHFDELHLFGTHRRLRRSGSRESRSHWCHHLRHLGRGLILGYRCRHRLHWRLHHHWLVHPRIARPRHGRWRQALAFSKPWSSRKGHHRSSFSISLGIVPGCLCTFRLSALLGSVSATLWALSSPVLLAFPVLVVVPALRIGLLWLLSSLLMYIGAIHCNLPRLLTNMAVTCWMFPQLAAAYTSPWGGVGHRCCNSTKETCVLRRMGLQNLINLM